MSSKIPCIPVDTDQAQSRNSPLCPLGDAHAAALSPVPQRLGKSDPQQHLEQWLSGLDRRQRSQRSPVQGPVFR